MIVIKPEVMLTLMDNDEKVFIMNSVSGEVGLECLSIEDLVELKVARVRDSASFSQQVDPVLITNDNKIYHLVIIINFAQNLFF